MTENKDSFIDQELRALGYDPETLELRGLALIRALKKIAELEKALAKEQQDHYYTRCTWEQTCIQRDALLSELNKTKP